MKSQFFKLIFSFFFLALIWVFLTFSKYPIHVEAHNEILAEKIETGNIIPLKVKLEPILLPHKICIKNPLIEFFMYHYVRYYDPNDTEQTSILSVDPKEFEAEMSYIRSLADNGSIALMQGNDFLDAVKNKCFPGKHIWIFTSDDGWVDNYTNLAPIASKYRIPFFFGIIEDRIDKTGFITTDQIRELSRNPLFTISSHSIVHGDQSRINQEEERKVLCQSKEKLEKLIQLPVLTYIYPSGRMSENSSLLAKECGYTLAWSTHFGKDWERDNPDLYHINRHPIHNLTGVDIYKNILTSESTGTEVFIDGEE